jgi:hypothetical protein
MAYPTVDKPYGLKPVNLIGGQVFAGATRQMEIATTANVGYGTSIFYGDLVKRVTGGTIEKDTGTTTATPCGVFLGCTFTNSSTGQVQFQQFYPASQSIASGTKIFAYVADDPDTLFQVVSCSGTTVIAAMGIAAIGTNIALIQNAGSTTLVTLLWRLTKVQKLQLIPSPSVLSMWLGKQQLAADNFPEVIVKINATMHQYNNATGV